jgi:hypothetical protein
MKLPLIFGVLAMFALTGCESLLDEPATNNTGAQVQPESSQTQPAQTGLGHRPGARD